MVVIMEEAMVVEHTIPREVTEVEEEVTEVEVMVVMEDWGQVQGTHIEFTVQGNGIETLNRLPNRLIMPYIPSPPKKKTFFSLTSVITLIPNFSTTHHTSYTTQHTPHTTHHTIHNTQHTTHNTQHKTHNTQHITHNTQYFKLSRPHFL